MSQVGKIHLPKVSLLVNWFYSQADERSISLASIFLQVLAFHCLCTEFLVRTADGLALTSEPVDGSDYVLHGFIIAVFYLHSQGC